MRGGTRPNAGRKPRKTPVANLHLKLEPEEKAAWIKQAASAGKTLTTWVKDKCNR